MKPTLTAIGWICDYRLDEDDWSAIEHGIKSVDESKDIWFDFPLAGKFEIKTSTSMEPGCSNYSLKIACEIDIKPQLDMVIGLAQCYRISDF